MANLTANYNDPYELLTCSICAECYDDSTHQAKFLSCHHTFCIDCLNNLSNKEQVNQATIQCPICRLYTRLPENGIDGLQTNFYIASFKELSENSDSPETTGNLLGCHGHSDQPISHFCVTCGKYLCRDCSVLYHTAKNGHSVISITDAETSYLKELNVSNKSVTQNNKNLRLIESEMTLLTAAKETAVKDMEAVIKLAHEQLEKHKKYLLNSILDQVNTLRNALLDKQKEIEEVNKMLNININQAKNVTKTGNIRKLKPISERLKKVNDKTQAICVGLDLGENHLIFDSNKGIDEYNDCVSKLGQTHSKGFLPSSVAFKNTEATIGNEATLTVDVYNHHGDKILISPDTFSVQVTDPSGIELHPFLSTTGSECAVTFTPGMSGLHKVSGIFLGQRLMNEESHISVSSDGPVLKFGEHGQGSGTFNGPWGIAIDNENCLYVADASNKLIQKFSADGEFLSQFSVALHNKDYTTVGIAIDLERKQLFCIEVLDQNNTLSMGKNILVFNLKGELQKKLTPSYTSSAYYITINKEGELIISDVGKKCLHKADTEGNFISSIGTMKFPSYSSITHDNSIIVPDKASDCVYIFKPDGSVMHKFGSSGTGKGQLKEPRGVATDGEYILVSEGGNNRIQVFKFDGTFVSMIKSTEDPLSQPRGLAVTKDGHVYVADRDNNCVKKFKYRDMQ